jgi:polar amino acid transport system substrate-binding protein
MRLTPIAVFALLSTSALPPAASAAPVSASAPLTILVENDAAPLSRPDGTGYANEVVLAAFDAVDLPVVLQVVPYARCKAMAIKGLAVACFNMSPAPDLDGQVMLADQPLFVVTPKYFVDPAHPLHAASERELRAGTRIGIVNGYEYPASLDALAARGVVLEASNSEVTNLKKLALGRLDAALVMLDDAKNEQFLLMAAGVTKLVVAFQSTPMGAYIGFSLKHPQAQVARRQFNLGLRVITANGTLAKIQHKWGVKAAPRAPGGAALTVPLNATGPR